ncbi:MAG: hypothetical protein KGZ61_06480 [Sandarakinorhabdus sp.]|nr:hypothetical protein [Sandarakinorhabdus sp.]
MGKRRPALNDSQMAFTFSAPPIAQYEGDLAGLQRMIASGCSRMLKEDMRSRAEIAGHVSAMLGDDVSKNMLDAYASEGRDDHNVSAARWLAMIAATQRFDILDAIISRIGARALVGEDMHAARLGSLMAAKSEIEEQIRALRPVTRPIRGGQDA